MEHYPSKVTGRFETRAKAQVAAEQLKQQAALSVDQIDVVGPADSHADQKLQPERREVRNAFIRWHVILGPVGLIVGLVVAWILNESEIPLFNSAPVIVTMALAVFGLLLGLLAGGAVSLRPDQGYVAAAAKDDARKGYWTVIAHTGTQEEYDAARSVLRWVDPSHQTL